MSERQNPRKDVPIPVMFGDGRTRLVTYDQIKGTHSPNLVITEVTPIKEGMLALARSFRERGTAFHENTLTVAIPIIDALTVEAAEAMATKGVWWPGPYDAPSTFDQLVATYRSYRVLKEEHELIRQNLEQYRDRLQEEGKGEDADRITAAVERIVEITTEARKPKPRKRR